MGRPNRFQIMELYQQDIITALKNLNKKILSNVDIGSTLFLYEQDWRLPKSTTVVDLLEFLIVKKKILRELKIDSERELQRFVFTDTDITPMEVALSLYPKLYLSHYSAVSFHDLTNEIVKSVYVNKEQSEKPASRLSDMTQANIDAAFSKPMRQTQNFVEYNGQRIYLLNGRYTNQLGVNNYNGVPVTNLERTLIDIAVRPDYAGGVYEVLSVYERAKGEASTNKIKAYLQKLNYIYPYHQAIGFYLERAGYSASALKLMESIPVKYDFYLTYNISDGYYSKKWRLYYPKHL